MERLLDAYLKKNHTTRYELAQLSGLTQSSLQVLNEHSLDSYTVRYIKVIGSVLHLPPETVLRELLELDKYSR